MIHGNDDDPIENIPTPRLPHRYYPRLPISLFTPTPIVSNFTQDFSYNLVPPRGITLNPNSIYPRPYNNINCPINVIGYNNPSTPINNPSPFNNSQSSFPEPPITITSSNVSIEELLPNTEPPITRTTSNVSIEEEITSNQNSTVNESISCSPRLKRKKSQNPKRPQMQARIGNKDWIMLCNLGDKIRECEVLFQEYHKFIQKKSNPKVELRVDIKNFDLMKLKNLNRELLKVAIQTNYRDLIVLGDLPSRVFRNPDGRVFYNIEDMNGKTRRIGAAAVSLFLNPNPCVVEMEPLRITCGILHRTVYEYSEHHPAYRPVDLHISHLCHNPACFNSKHLLIESQFTNLKRNVCRRECTCNANPPCYTEF